MGKNTEKNHSTHHFTISSLKKEQKNRVITLPWLMTSMVDTMASVPFHHGAHGVPHSALQASRDHSSPDKVDEQRMGWSAKWVNTTIPMAKNPSWHTGIPYEKIE